MSERSADLDRERVAAALERVRAGVRQRQAVLAATRGAGDEAGLALAELRERELVREPLAESPRPVVGRLLVFLRRAGFHLFVKWWARPVLGQQNAFNQAASRLLDQLARERARDAEAAARLARRVEELEARVEALETGRGGEAR
ncbi:MAG TPA: hypothetical protein VHM02_12275 [Thermoanaerobaculia bacterium]|nr:hypothetical protein [Thermoanaerobaculia bacterium]